MDIIDIVKIIGAAAAVVGTCFSIWNSKRIVLRRIENKKEKIRQIDHRLVLLYGLHRGSFHPQTYLDSKKERLNRQIESLQRLV